ncbi:MAG: proliferating cell nuclear antigen (pcna) [Candidatus Helarchaeota archaeon]
MVKLQGEIMFKASLESAGSFIKIIDALATIIDTGTFKASKEGLSMRAIDPTHVAMVDLEMPSTAFTDYKCDREIPIRVNLIDLNRFMKRGSASDQLELLLDEERNKFKVKFKKGKSTRTFSLSLITEGDEEEVPTPSIDFNAKFSLNTDELQRAIKDAQIVGEYITFSVSEESFILEASGDSGDVTIELEDFIEKPVLKGKESAIYSLEFLADIIKAGSVAGIVNIEFSSEMPVKFEFPLDSNNEMGKIVYFLAPRVEEEEEEMDEIVAEEGEFEEDFEENFEDE